MLSADDRLVSWSDFIEQTTRQKGTVIVEVGNKSPTRFWWVLDDLLSRAPLSAPKFEQLNYCVYGGSDQHPFNRWCYDNYTSPLTGRAVLVHPIEAVFETFPSEPNYAEHMKARFPNQQVVIVTFYDVRYIF